MSITEMEHTYRSRGESGLLVPASCYKGTQNATNYQTINFVFFAFCKKRNFYLYLCITMKIENITGLNYLKITLNDGTVKLLPKSFIVKAGINGHILIGSESMLYEYDEAEITVIFSDIEGQEGKTFFEVLVYLARFFIGTTTEKVDLYTDLRVANLIKVVQGKMSHEEFLATLIEP